MVHNLLVSRWVLEKTLVDSTHSRYIVLRELSPHQQGRDRRATAAAVQDLSEIPPSHPGGRGAAAADRADRIKYRIINFPPLY